MSDKRLATQAEADMVEFFIETVRNGYQLVVDGVDLGTFGSRETAADIAMRFAQDHDAPAYRIFY